VVWRTGGNTVDGPAGNDRCGQAANAWRGWGGGVRGVLGRMWPGEGVRCLGKARGQGSDTEGGRGARGRGRHRGAGRFQRDCVNLGHFY
jgi:hypothetical protein